MDSKTIIKYAAWAAAIYGTIKLYKNVKAKGGIMPFLGLQK